MHKDKIIKASWNHFEGAKNILINNILTAVRDQKIKIDNTELNQLVFLMTTSLEEGYHKGYKTFDRELTSCLADTSKSQPKVAQSKKN
jgi:hypothetical protein